MTKSWHVFNVRRLTSPPPLTTRLNTHTGMLFSLHSVIAVSSITFRLSKHTCLRMNCVVGATAFQYHA